MRENIMYSSLDQILKHNSYTSSFDFDQYANINDILDNVHGTNDDTHHNLN